MKLTARRLTDSAQRGHGFGSRLDGYDLGVFRDRPAFEAIGGQP